MLQLRTDIDLSWKALQSWPKGRYISAKIKFHLFANKSFWNIKKSSQMFFIISQKYVKKTQKQPQNK